MQLALRDHWAEKSHVTHPAGLIHNLARLLSPHRVSIAAVFVPSQASRFLPERGEEYGSPWVTQGSWGFCRGGGKRSLPASSPGSIVPVRISRVTACRGVTSPSFAGCLISRAVIVVFHEPHILSVNSCWWMARVATSRRRRRQCLPLSNLVLSSARIWGAKEIDHHRSARLGLGGEEGWAGREQCVSFHTGPKVGEESSLCSPLCAYSPLPLPSFRVWDSVRRSGFFSCGLSVRVCVYV